MLKSLKKKYCFFLDQESFYFFLYIFFVDMFFNFLLGTDLIFLDQNFS